MTEKIKEAILNPTQKKRYQISAEYFSRGAANELKNKFNLPQLKGIENIVGKIKKEKEVDEEKEKSKKSVIGKIAILSGLVIGGVLLFKNLNNLFPNKKQDTNTSEEISYALDETKIDNSVKELNETLRKSYIDGFSTPLIDGIKLLTSINPSTLGEELTRGLTNDQILHNGIIGQVLYNITLAATWHVFERRGYEFILATFDFPMADRVYFNVGMWRKYKTDPTQYAHVGRDLVNNSIKGAEIVTETFDNKDVVLSQTITGQFMQTTRTFLTLGSYIGEVVSNNYQDILNNLVISQEDLLRGRLNRNHKIIGAHLMKMKREQVGTGQYTYSGIGTGAVRQEILETRTVPEEDYTWKPFADYIDDWDEYDNGGLPPTVVRAPAQYTFINKQWDYVYEMYEFNKTNQTIQDLLPTYQMLIRPRTDDDKNKFWSMGDLARLVQLSYYAAEWELYQALQSINSARGLYQEIFRKQQIDVLTNKIAQRELQLRRQAESFQIAYANGQIDAQDVVSKMKERILEISKKPLKWIENDIKLHSNSYRKQIPYMNIKEMVGRIKREVLRLGVSGTKEENVLVLDNQSLRDNFDLRRRQNVDTNSNVQGQQFDKKSIRSAANVYSDDEHANLYGINPYYKIAYWWGTWQGGMNLGSTKLLGQPGRGFGGELIFYGWRTYQRGENYKRYLDITDEDGDEARAWAEVAFDPSGYSLTKEFPEDSIAINQVQNHYHSTKHFAAYDYVVKYTRFLGTNFINRYETYENGNFYLIDVCEYFDKENKFIGYREIERKPSLKSHAAIYQGEYNADKLDELYTLPLELLEKNLKDVADYVTQELSQAYEERNRLIEEIHSQCQVDSQDQNLRRLIISK